ncbi:MAG TPA: LPS export ABC transporter periplasmic protein LptC [Alphaproteobacteria bacterium]|jgi:lipopolysaccharide export system protein LptC|nr:LPS export ABC transporter periplasmic protein LptC [Alphaproteobacteria bacterium]
MSGAAMTLPASENAKLDRLVRRTRTIKLLSQRYSRFVGLMKFVLPATALGLTGLVLAWPGGGSDPDAIRLSFASLESDEQGNPGMTNARFVGSDRRDRPFLVTADRALQDNDNPGRVNLRTLQADMTLSNGMWLTMIAESGLYDRDKQTLDLVGPVNIFSDAGYEFHAQSSTVDLAAATASSDLPVKGQGPFGVLSADGFRFLDQGRRLIFEGGVKLVVHPGGRQ